MIDVEIARMWWAENESRQLTGLEAMAEVLRENERLRAENLLLAMANSDREDLKEKACAYERICEATGYFDSMEGLGLKYADAENESRQLTGLEAMAEVLREN